MEMKKLHMGTVVFTWDSMDEVSHLLDQVFDGDNREHIVNFKSDTYPPDRRQNSLGPGAGPRGRRDISTRVKDAVMALATCHNVCLVGCITADTT